MKMIKIKLFLIIIICILVSCKKEDDANISPFYEQPRNIIYSNNFEYGIQSFRQDSTENIYYGTWVYLQTESYYVDNENNIIEGYSCGAVDPGFLNVGCPGLIVDPEGYERKYIYEYLYVDEVYAFVEILKFDDNFSDYDQIAFQIDYKESGYTLIKIGEYELESNFKAGAFDNKTIDILFYHEIGGFSAFSDGIDISDQFNLDKDFSDSNYVKFQVIQELDVINDEKYLNLPGMRIEKVEVYSF